MGWLFDPRNTIARLFALAVWAAFVVIDLTEPSRLSDILLYIACGYIVLLIAVRSVPRIRAWYFGEDL